MFAAFPFLPEKLKYAKKKTRCLFVRNISYLHFMKQENDHTGKEPTKSEVEILQVLWENGPCTVRFVNDRLNEQKRAVQYTSTLKLMQIMTEKGLLIRDETSMKHVYSAAVEEQQTKGLLLDRFVNAIFNGSASSLMMQLLGDSKTTKKEIQEIRELLNQLGKESSSS